MRKILVVFPLMCTLGACAQPPELQSSPNLTETWSGEFVNTYSEPPRELVVKVWYPAVDKGGRSPLILLAPGRGVPSVAYSRVSQFLAGQGFIVVAVDSPGSGRQLFADGRVVPPDPALRPPPGMMAGPYIEVDRFFAATASSGASDLRYVLDSIAAPAADNGMPFAGRVDTTKVGLLGHSLGGRIAGAFAATDDRVAAWIGVEGVAPRAARRQGLGIPAMEILSEVVWPYAIGNVREMAWCTTHPTYFVKMAGIEHNTITDGDEENVLADLPEDQRRMAVLIQLFFEHHITNPDSPLVDWPEGLSVEQHFAPSKERPPEQECNS